MQLVLEQQVVHRPELALRRGDFRHLRREQRMGMHFLLRKMAKGVADAPREAIQQQLHRRRRLLAVGTFEIAVLHH